MNNSNKVVISLLTILLLTGCSKDKPTATKEESLNKIVSGYVETPYTSDYIDNGRSNGGMFDHYSKNISGKDLPEKVDLRDRGLVTNVKNQGYFGTCWAFGTTASAETSILRNLNTTFKDFKSNYGYSSSVGTKHSAYFSILHLPKADDYNEGEYPFPSIKNQEGEGKYRKSGSTDIYNFGGFSRYVTSAATSNMGLNFEKDYKYLDKDGKANFNGDWSIEESHRFESAIQIENCIYYPNTWSYDRQNNATFNQSGVNEIKRAINNGNAVSVCYYSGNEGKDATDDDITSLSKAIQKKLGSNYDNYTSDEISSAIRALYNGNYYYSFDEDLRDTVLEILAYFFEGANISDETSLDEAKSKIKKEKISDKNFNSKTSAQNNNVYRSANHLVCIVGYDDTFSKDNFIGLNQPDGDGAWIVKNSWATSWGDDGYFYMSYYDKSSSNFCSVDAKIKTTTFDNCYSYEYSSAPILQTAVYEEKVKSANVFKISKSCSLESFCFENSLEDTNLEYSIYKLKGNAKTPTDGKLLEKGSKSYDNPGLYREYINTTKTLSAGDKVAVVIEQKNPEGYLLANPTDYSEKHSGDSYSYIKACVNQGESYVYSDGNWVDYSDVVTKVSSYNSGWAWDNFSIKLTTK